MAIAIRGTTPLVVSTVSNPISGTLTTTRQPQGGDLLVIMHANDYYDLASMPTPTVGGSTSGVTAVTNGSADAGNPNAHVKTYTYVVGSTGDLTVAVTESGSGDEEKVLVVYVLSGADIATPIDGGSSGAAGSFSSTGQTSMALTGVSPSGSDAFLIYHVNSGGGSSGGTPYTPPSGGFTEQYDTATGGVSYTGGTLQLAVSGATGTKTVVGNGGSISWAGVLLAIKTAGAATAPAFPPSRQVRRRLATAPLLPRNRARISTPVRAQVNPPFPFTGVKQPRRLRALAPRRGESAMPVPPQVIVTAPKFPPSTVRPRLKGLRLFRGHASAPVPAQAVVVAPAYPPQSVRSRVRGLRLFRGRTAGQIPGQDRNPAPTPPRPRLRGLRVRGDIASPVPPQVVVVPPAYPPQSVRTRLRGLRLFRGHAASPVPPQIVVTPATFVPQPVHTRVRGLRLFRGRAAAPVPPQVVVLPPAYPPQSVRSRLKGLRPARGRESAMPVPAQIVIVAPKFPPLFSRIKQHAARIFRGATRTPVVAVCDCDTHRPNVGVTLRPGAAGMTARPDGGATTRPCTCSGGG